MIVEDVKRDRRQDAYSNRKDDRNLPVDLAVLMPRFELLFGRRDRATIRMITIRMVTLFTTQWLSRE